MGDLETAAGFAPRSGALYQYFPSKRALLEAAIERHIEQNRELRRLAALLPLDDAVSELQILARWLLASLREAESITRIMEKDGESAPDLRARFSKEVVEPGYATAAEIVSRLGGADHDCEAVGAVLMASLVNYRRHEWTFGRPPLGIDEGRFVTAWVHVAKAILIAGDDVLPPD